LWNNNLTDSFVNNVGENIIEIARTIIKKSPKTKMFVQTVLPIGKQEYIEPIKNLNDIIKSNAEFYNVIDLYVEFVNEKGLMPSFSGYLTLDHPKAILYGSLTSKLISNLSSNLSIDPRILSRLCLVPF